MLGNTIAAIATPPGQGGIGIIRISGDQALPILKRVFLPLGEVEDYKPRFLYLGSVLNKQREILDQALAVYMPGPHSYTGEDVAELQCHGGYVVCREILGAVLGAGAALAEPGEFTSRAFINGKLSLDQAESVIDIIEAQSAEALKISARQLGGSLRQKLAAAADFLLDILARLELAMDYPEETEEGDLADWLNARLSEAAASVKELLRQAQYGRLYREGLLTAIVGPANAGKSTLLNSLLEEERAIVTPIPGTTRDTVEETYILEGLPLRLVDTAGIRETADPVEQAGIERSRRAISQADLLLLVLDSGDCKPKIEPIWRDLLAENIGRPLLILLNKCDTASSREIADLRGELLHEVAGLAPAQILDISAREGQGIPELKAAVKEMLLGESSAGQLSGLINDRQRQALEVADKALTEAQNLLAFACDLNSLSIDVQTAWQALAEIGGRAASEEIINRVFARFCLGK